MPTNSQLANLFIGVEPPTNPDAATRWISQSMRHAQVPHTPFSRTPIIGSGGPVNGGNTSATQEMTPWYNAATARYECIVNTGGQQKFWYAQSPLGPWSSNTAVLGLGVGGEAAFCQQCTVYIESGVLYAFYLTAGSGAGASTVQMASAPMPATAASVPVFTKQGAVFSEGLVINESPWVIKVNGTYYMFTAVTGAQKITSSPASSPTGFVAQPFSPVTGTLKMMNVNLGVRYTGSFGRPQVTYENGTWIFTGHLLTGIDFATCNVYRFTCNDPGIPLNWIADSQKPFLQQMHPLEVDQIADFRILQGPNELKWAFWTAANNPAALFSIMCAPVQDTILAYDGIDWYPTSSQINNSFGQLHTNPDAANGSQTTQNTWDLMVDTTGGNRNVTFPIASAHVFHKATNCSSTPSTVNRVHLLPGNTTNVIQGGNPITAISAVGTAVTVTTEAPHNLSVADFVTVTGSTPNTYNGNALAVASVPSVNSFTYTAGSAPAANTVLPSYDRSLRTGETGRWKCRLAGTFVRD